MSKYFKIETKKRAIRMYGSGKGNIAIGRELGVSPSQVLRWINIYSRFGKKALNLRNRKVDYA